MFTLTLNIDEASAAGSLGDNELGINDTECSNPFNPDSGNYVNSITLTHNGVQLTDNTQRTLGCGGFAGAVTLNIFSLNFICFLNNTRNNIC